MLELLLIETKEYIKGEFQAIKDTVLEIKKGNFGDLFTMGEGRHFHRTVLAYVNQMFQQISGMLKTQPHTVFGVLVWIMVSLIDCYRINIPTIEICSTLTRKG